MVTVKKPKKDEVINREGVVTDISQTLITVDSHNIAVLGDKAKEIREKEIIVGDTVTVSSKNGILLTIDPIIKYRVDPDPNMHIDKISGTPNIFSPTVAPSEAPAVIPTADNSSTQNDDVHMQKCRFCGGKTRVVGTIGSGMYLTQCISCKMVDTDPQM